MAENKVKLHRVETCDLGKLGPDGVALKINFVVDGENAKKGSRRSAVFGLSNEMARGLLKALTATLKAQTKTPN